MGFMVTTFPLSPKPYLSKVSVFAKIRGLRGENMKTITLLFLVLSFGLISCGNRDFEIGETQEALQSPERLDRQPDNQDQNEPVDIGDVPEDDDTPVDRNERPACIRSLYYDQLQPVFSSRACNKANSSQLNQVNLGNAKKDQFLSQCYQQTNSSCWCDQLVRPNPDSFATFQCTYGVHQIHQLIHPNESTWKYAFEAVKIVEEFESQNLAAEIIYNWWRPEPYNKNVGGAAGRHPFGTSIDVRFKSKNIQEKAFLELCKMRKRGRLRAIGYYASTALHFGIGDSTANTWGKSCP